MLVYRAAAVLLELKLEMLSLWQMALLWMLLAWSAEMLLIMLAEELGMNLLVVSVCLVSVHGGVPNMCRYIQSADDGICSMR